MAEWQEVRPASRACDPSGLDHVRKLHDALEKAALDERSSNNLRLAPSPTRHIVDLLETKEP